ncbi:bifunctional sugar phosphate isomerase/epimerase/4-hydroxyphenylpyruvate dioxygenase family protein [Derxia gummosa]|uniref:3-dehydroshikimate dehydratase n=1 Tax=Derxia gummosa DSM 723 TaxID=1121388 RepID=A0A8B6X9F0_9BURK|nr:sugar phosphate isomerase/epimerase and 4-hydroxyphenylpyruvate domain-containing protein [Derxia gummosa]
MRRSIATVSISGALEDKMESIARARFDGFEVFENDLIHSALAPRQIGALAADLGLSIDLYQPFRDFDAADDRLFRRNLDRAERKFDLMGELGATMILICSNVSPTAATDDAQIAGQLYELAERAAKRGIRLAYESLAWARHVWDYRHCWNIVRQADHPHLGVCLDSFHILSRGLDPKHIEDIASEKIFFLQLADAPLMTMDVLQWSRHYRCFPGQGGFDLPKFLGHVLAAGYAGPLSLEIFNDVFREAPSRDTTHDAMRSLLWLEEQVKLRAVEGLDVASAIGAAAPEAREADVPADAVVAAPAAARSQATPLAAALGRLELFSPPAPPRIDGTAFVEFAVDDGTEAALGRVFSALGFERAGEHRSKRVTLWRQGDTNLVINNEPGSFASEFFRQHGPSICAIALRTDDGQRAVNRATAFHLPRFEGRVGPHETTIPAVRTVDGSILYFVSPELEARGFWDIDFRLAEPANRAIGLGRVDHIAIAAPIESFDSAVLFQRAALGLEPGDSLELTDPYGMVRSRALSNADRSLRVALNVSQSRSTVIARSVSSMHGAGVHHLAFDCADIFASVAAARGRGLAFLDIPDNYYDDLAARFDIDAAVLDRLRMLRVLYDRDASGGEFLHAYTPMFEGRFFFELVQRIGGYDGYGASNAPVRMAALARDTTSLVTPPRGV